MSCNREQFVKVMQSWVGLNEYDGSHKKIIDIYNSITPLPVGYNVTYTDPWCAATVSAAAKVCDALDIIPAECGCGRMITLAKSMGIWVEEDNRVPAFGDIIMYDWQDNGAGDNKGEPEHVGVVEKVSGNNIVIIEGNYSDSVKRRTIAIDGRYIRGFIVPRFDDGGVVEDPDIPEEVNSDYTLEQFIKDVQKATGAEVDGIAGPETLSKTVTLSASKNNRHDVVDAVQKRLNALGYSEVGDADGVAGSKFTKAVERFQNDNSCSVDGEITNGKKTWRKLLGME